MDRAKADAWHRNVAYPSLSVHSVADPEGGGGGGGGAETIFTINFHHLRHCQYHIW